MSRKKKKEEEETENAGPLREVRQGRKKRTEHAEQGGRRRGNEGGARNSNTEKHVIPDAGWRPLLLSSGFT